MFRVKNGRFPAFKSPVSLELGINERWAFLGPTKRDALDVVAGKYVADPPTALSYPAFGKDVWPSQAIQLVRFGASVPSARAPYLSARYESFRDEFDYTLKEMLAQQTSTTEAIDAVAEQMHLKDLLGRWIVSLSNGQKRRAQLAMALLKSPRLLLVDEPFLGLDPHNRELMSHVLGGLDIPVVLGLRSAGEVPNWITHLGLATTTTIQGGDRHAMAHVVAASEQRERASRPVQPKTRVLGEPVIELRGINVAYRGNHVLKDFHMTARKGERVHIAGSNGSGKTTLLAMLTADHPQSWNEKVVLFGEPREVGKHNYFRIQEQIGHSSPEIHAIFPKRLSVRNSVLTGYTGSRVPPEHPTRDQLARADELCSQLGLSDLDRPFGECSLAEQKLVLFARALVRDPPILILDEAFSTLLPDQLATAMAVLDNYEGTALVVGHVAEEIPPCDQKIDLGSN